MTKTATFGLTLIATIMAITVGPAQPQEQALEYAPPPLSYPVRQYYRQHPDEFQQLLRRFPVSHELVPGTLLAPGQIPAGGSWTSLNHPAGVNLGFPLLLTDGTVMAHATGCSSAWYKFTPDITGSYVNGTWTQIQSTASNYAPRFFGSAVLPDARVIIEGGEYNGATSCANNASNDTTQGAIYDPVANVWTPVNPPSGWTSIGDAAGIVLPNGTYMQTSCCDQPPPAALLNPSTLTWTPTGTGKFDRYDEEALALLPSGLVLTVDAYTSGVCGTNSEVYNPATGAWTSAGSTIAQQADCSGKQSFEVGPVVMRPDGTAVSFSGVTTGTPQTAIYNTNTNSWSVGPSHPSVGGLPYTMADAPAAVLPNGNVLVAMSPSNWTARNSFFTPTHYFELNISNNTFTQVADKVDSANFNSFEENFLVLPTGQIMAFTLDGPTVQIYTPTGTYQSSWQPVVSSVPGCVNPGGTYQASGTQFNGLTQGAYYGDDANAWSNYPLVKIVNNSTQHAFYARTFNHSTRSIAPNAAVSTSFTVASATETGPSTLYVVANGIPSAGVPISVMASTCPILQVTPSSNIAASGPQGGPFSPSSFQYQLSASIGSVGFSITGTPSWLTASATSGTVTTTPTSVTFTVNSNANSLTQSTYLGAINFINTTSSLGSTSRTASLAVGAAPTTCSLTYAPSTVTFGQGLSVSWSATNATSRTYSIYDSSNNLLYASPSIAVSGSTTVASFTNLPAGTYTRRDTVTGTGGTATCSATLTVVAGSTACTISYAPSTVTFGLSLSVSWDATNATSRTYSIYDSANNLLYTSANIAVSGAVNVPSFTNLPPGTYTRRDTVSGAGGTATCSAALTVVASSVTCTIVYTPSTVKFGQPLTVTWNATNATSRAYNIYDSANKLIFASAGISVSGTFATSSFTDLSVGSYTRQDTVNGPGGSGACSATLTIN
jgi:hypothetical protein